MVRQAGAISAAVQAKQHGAKIRTLAVALAVAVVGIFSSSTLAMGEETSSTLRSVVSPWSTSTHLGFATADQSTTGFSNVSGSLVFLDITRPVTRRLEVGLRSIAEGGSLSARQFYRLGAGPLVSYKIDAHWLAQASAGYFSESGLGANDKRLYQSRGGEAQIGWERVWSLGAHVEAAWGGFATYHRGSIGQQATTSRSTVAMTDLNAGLSHGMEVALRLSL